MCSQEGCLSANSRSSPIKTPNTKTIPACHSIWNRTRSSNSPNHLFQFSNSRYIEEFSQYPYQQLVTSLTWDNSNLSFPSYWKYSSISIWESSILTHPCGLIDITEHFIDEMAFKDNSESRMDIPTNLYQKNFNLHCDRCLIARLLMPQPIPSVQGFLPGENSPFLS